MKHRSRLPRTARVTSDEQAVRLRNAARTRGRWFVVRRLDNEVGYARILVRVAKQVLRSSVDRNRMKRCVREVFRHQRGELASVDFFVSLIQPYKHPSLLDARQELEILFHR